jgi:hypothetical protein
MTTLAELRLAQLSVVRLSGIVGIVLGASVCSTALAGSVPDGTPAPPAQRGVNIGSGPKAPATDEPIERLQMSADLLVFGRKTKDPLALIVAARVMKALGGTEIDLKPETRTTAADAQKPGQPVSPEAILAEARDLGRGDKITMLLVDETAATVAGGAGGERKTHQDTVQPGGTDVYRVVFTGGQLAEVGVAGDGDSDLDLYVYDNNDNLVCRSASSSDREYCHWWPRWTGPFRIEVQNLGMAANSYRVMTN